jgi:hypothetical protein
MAKMILGREIVARVLKTGNIRPYLDAGLTSEFMADALNPAYASVFTGQDIDAWNSLLKHHEKYSKVMAIDLFRRSYPPESYRIRESEFDDRELTDLAKAAIGMYNSEVGAADIQKYLLAGNHTKAAEIMMATARKVLFAQAEAAIVSVWDRKDFDLEERLRLVRKPGPGFGIEEIDKQFPGLQNGQLAYLIGRAKSTKTTLLVQSAYHAWFGTHNLNGREDVDPKRVLFITFEVPEDDIRDMLTCYGAGVNFGKYIASTKDYRLTETEMNKVRDFWTGEMKEAAEAFTVVQPMSRFGLAELEYEIEKAEPEIVYIDGFYFMTDVETGSSPGSNAFAHDNLARGIKNACLHNKIPLFLTHQAREKQLGKAGGGFDDVAMMGGTGLRMAGDIGFTADRGEDGIVTLKNTAIRRGNVETVKGEWDYDEFRFSAYQRNDPRWSEDDAEDY